MQEMPPTEEANKSQAVLLALNLFHTEGKFNTHVFREKQGTYFPKALTWLFL